MGRLIRKLIILLSVLLVLVLVTAWVIAWKFEKQAKQYFLSLLNDQLTTELTVDGGMELSLWTHFPNAAFSFKNVSLQGSLKSSDSPLLALENLSFVFGWLDLFRGTYSLKYLSLEDGQINVEIDKQGKSNYEIFKEGGEANESRDIRLDMARLSNVDLSLGDRALKQRLSYFITGAEVQAKIQPAKRSLRLKSDGILNYFELDGFNYLSTKDLGLDVDLETDEALDFYKLNQAKLSLVNNHFLVGGSIRLSEGKQIYDLQIAGVDLNLVELLDLLPDGEWAALDFTDQGGDLLFEASVKGIYSALQHPAVQASVDMSNAILRHKYLGYPMKDFAVQLDFDNGPLKSLAASTIRLNDLSFNLLGERLVLRAEVKNLLSPLIKLDLQGIFDCYAMSRYADKHGWEDLNGKLSFEGLQAEGRLDAALGDISMSGYLQSDIAARYKDEPVAIQNMRVALLGKDLQIQQGSLHSPGGQLNFDGSLRGIGNTLLKYALADSLTDYSKLPMAEVDLDLSAEQLYLTPLLAMLQSEDEEQPSEDTLAGSSIADFLRTDLHFNFGKLIHEQLEIEHLQGSIRQLEDYYYLRDMSMKAFGGSAKCDAKIQLTSSGKLFAQNYLRLGGIRAEELMRQMDNFGQEQLTGENISGRLDGEFYFETTYNAQQELDIDGCYLVGDFTVQDGRIKDFAPLQDLSEASKVLELSDLRFSRLDNQIQFKNRLLRIPTMKISSNAFSLNFAGNTTHKRDVQYFVQVDLWDMVKKKMRNKARNPGEGSSPKGLSSLYITMNGSMDDPIIKLGQKKKVKAKFIKDANTKKLDVANFVDW